MAEFTMPSLGADMESGTLLEWLVKPGDEVHRGDVMAVVGTEKGDIEIEVFEDGVVDELLVDAQREVPVGTVLAVVRGAGDEKAAPAKTPAAAPKAEKPAPQPVAVPAGEAVAPVVNGHRIRVSPLARKLAAELGVDLDRVEGTGPHGAIDRADVERAAAKAKEAGVAEPMPKAAPKAAETPAAKPATRAADDFQTGMRRAIALAMAKSNREIPHYYLEQRIDMRNALRWLEAENQQRSIKERVLPVVLLLKATAKALAKVPQLNGFWLDDRLQVSEAIHIGFAIALRQGGLITPAIHHTDLLDMDELMAAVRDLIMRTRAGRLRGSEMTDATIVLTSLGDMGVDKVYGVIYPPQVALVGFGKIMDEVWVQDGLIGVRPVVHATLAGDHRASDGRTGAEFLDLLDKLLQEPAALWR
ncbi:MAG: 2-oxo acid dehydrogenase subunit E2 [Caldilineaceae bacterium]|nr:2-oxo acid dehydrogenase subunit E2 [Caldilineaceae bacterium]